MAAHRYVTMQIEDFATTVDIVDDPDVKLLVLIVLLAGLAGAVWYFRDVILVPADEPAAVQPAPVAEDEPAPGKPVYPIVPSQPFDRKLQALPPLDDSDGYFLLTLIDSFGPEAGRILADEALIDKFVATIDGLTRHHVPEKIRPVGRLSGMFNVDVTGGDGQFQLGPGNYKRYDLLVGLVAKADLEVVAATYRRFYPLFQESYVRLGYPNGYFNDRVVEVIDHLLLAPAPKAPIRLVRPNVLYEFADEELETLSSGQKLLVRMGAEHASSIKHVLTGLRGLIVQ